MSWFVVCSVAMLPGAPIRRDGVADLSERATAHNGSIEIAPPLSALTADQIVERAREYRRMAAIAATPEMRNTLNQLANGFAMFAGWRQMAAAQGPLPS